MFPLILIALALSLQYEFTYVHEEVQNYVI